MADKKPTRLPKDFNQNKVDDHEITNPERAAQEAAGIPVDTEYPKHLHQFVGVGQVHEFVVVTNAKEEAAQRKQGYVSIQEANAEAREAQAALDAAPHAPKVPKAAHGAAPANAPKAAKAAKAPKVKAPKAPKAAKGKAVTEPGEPAAN